MNDGYTLIIMDLIMEDSNGIALAMKIREYDGHVPIVFISSTNDHAMETYEVDAAYFIQKPLTAEEFRDVIQIVVRKMNPKSWTVTIDDDYTCRINDICYVKHKGNACVYYLANHDSHVSSKRMEENCRLLRAYPFFYRAGVDVMVNLYQVDHVENNSILLHNGHDIHLTKKGMKEFLAVYTRFTFKETIG